MSLHSIYQENLVQLIIWQLAVNRLATIQISGYIRYPENKIIDIRNNPTRKHVRSLHSGG